MKNAVKLRFFMTHLMFVFSSANASVEVTMSALQDHDTAFLIYIDAQSSDISKLQWIPSDWAAKKAVKMDGGYDGFSYECIKATFPFFKRIKDKKYLRKLMASLHEQIDHINGMVKRYYDEKPADVNSLFRITHQETIKRVNLPADIDKEELFTSHAKCKKIAHLVDQDEKDKLILAGLFAKYWVEEVKR